MFDIYYIILVVPTIFLSLVAQILVKTTFARYSRVASGRRITGAEAARVLMDRNGVRGVRIEPIGGSLSDHYNPATHVLSLSEPVYGKISIAAIGVAAHETGHAIQHATAYGPLGMRSSLVPAANIGSSLGPWLAVAGIMFNRGFLINLGIILFSVSVLFYLVTLPVEFNASRRALVLLEKDGILGADEIPGARKVLAAAAMTYVASALTQLASLARLVLLSRNRRD